MFRPNVAGHKGQNSFLTLYLTNEDKPKIYVPKSNSWHAYYDRLHTPYSRFGHWWSDLKGALHSGGKMVMDQKEVADFLVVFAALSLIPKVYVL